MKKDFLVVVRQFVFPESMHLYVCLSLGKSAVTFGLFHESAENFQGPFNPLQVIFGQVIWTVRP